jgi:DNA polymerase-3 subunit gamma/tau
VSDSPARRQAAAAAQRLEEAERSIRQDPYVLGLMRDFGGRIVPGTLRPVTPAP